MKLLRPIIILSVSFLTWAGLSDEVLTQELDVTRADCFPPAPSPGDSTDLAVRSPERSLAATEVPYWAERDRLCLAAYSETVRVGVGLPRTREGLAGEASSIRTLANEHSLEAFSGYSVRELEGARERWTAYQSMVQDWSLEVAEQLAVSGIIHSETLRMHRRWTATTAGIVQDSLLLATQGQIDNLIGTVLVLTDTLTLHDVDLLTLAGVVGELDSTVRDALARVQQAQGEVRARLLRPTRPLLVVSLSREWDPEGSLQAARRGVRDELNYIRNWATRSSGVLITQVLLVLLLAGLVRHLNRALAREAGAEEAEAPEPDGANEGAAREPEGAPSPEDTLSPLTLEGLVVQAMGRRSLSAGYLLSILFVPLLFGSAPLLVKDLLLILATVPVVLLLRTSVPGPMRPLVLRVTLLFGIYSVLLLVLPNAPVRRLMVFIAAGVGVWLTGGLVSWYRTAESASWRRGALLFLPPMRLGFAVAAVAEFLGLAGLAEMLVTALVSLLFFALVLRLLSLAVVGLLLSVPFTGLGSHLLALRRHSTLIAERLRPATAAISVLVWFWIALHLFGFVGDLQGIVGWVLDAGLTLGSLDMSLGDVLAFSVSIWLSFQISRFIRFALEEEVYPRAHLPRGVPEATSSLTHYAILTIGFVVALGAAGIELGRITLLVSALGVGIGFGLQTVVANFVSGLILLFERPVTVGDTVEVGTLLGRVTRVGMRASTVRTYDGAEVIVPNMDLVGQQVINWTLSDRRRRVEMVVGAAYGTDPERVMDILRKVATDHPEVLAFPEPMILFQGFGDSSLDFSLRCWIADFDRGLIVRSELSVSVNALLAQAGIEIPFPQRDLHLRSVDPAAGLALAGDSSDSDPTDVQPKDE